MENVDFKVKKLFKYSWKTLGIKLSEIFVLLKINIKKFNVYCLYLGLLLYPGSLIEYNFSRFKNENDVLILYGKKPVVVATDR